MSSSCVSCNCADKSQCGKNGFLYTIGEEHISATDEYMFADAPMDEHDGKCKCGSSCSCTTCTCGH